MQKRDARLLLFCQHTSACLHLLSSAHDWGSHRGHFRRFLGACCPSPAFCARPFLPLRASRLLPGPFSLAPAPSLVLGGASALVLSRGVAAPFLRRVLWAASHVQSNPIQSLEPGNCKRCSKTLQLLKIRESEGEIVAVIGPGELVAFTPFPKRPATWAAADPWRRHASSGCFSVSREVALSDLSAHSYLRCRGPEPSRAPSCEKAHRGQVGSCWRQPRPRPFEKRRAPAFALGRHSFLATLVKESQSFSESEQGPVRSVEVGQAEDGG